MRITCRVFIQQKHKGILALKTIQGYVLPGGRFKPGVDESFQECARRELVEETGISVKRANLKLLFHGISDSGTYTYTFTAKVDDLPDDEEFRTYPEGKPEWIHWATLVSPEAKHPAYNSLVLEAATNAR